nr:MAG TPA: hypothetical protein [Caudoviricetes sp.]
MFLHTLTILSFLGCLKCLDKTLILFDKNIVNFLCSLSVQAFPWFAHGSGFFRFQYKLPLRFSASG